MKIIEIAGIVLLVFVAGGVIWITARQPNKNKPREDSRSKSAQNLTASRETKTIRLALAIFAEKLPADGLDGAKVADLVARTTYWWAGTPDSWELMHESDALQPLHGSPASENALIVILVDIPAESPPASRLEAASQIRSAASKGSVRILDQQYTVVSASALTAAGFNW